jgi:hypothetical protein
MTRTGIAILSSLGLASVVGAAVFLATADAEAQYTRQFPGNARAMTAAESAHVLTAVGGCWSHPNPTVRVARIYRGAGADADRLFTDIVGERRLTREETRERLRTNGDVPAGLIVGIPPVERCEILGAARRRAVEALARALWPYAFDTWRTSTFIYSPSARTVTCIDTRGAIGMSEDAVLDALENGESVQLEREPEDAAQPTEAPR